MHFEYYNRSVSDSEVEVVDRSLVVRFIRIHNRTATPATITIRDRATAPFSYYEDVEVAAHSVINESCNLRFKDGITVESDTDDALTLYVLGKCPLSDPPTVPLEIASVELVASAPYPDYETGDDIVLAVQFSSDAYLSLPSGNPPSIALDIDGSAVEAEYVSGSGTKRWLFSYTVADGDAALAGEFSVASAIVLNDGLIGDLTGDALPSTAFTAPDASNVTVTDIVP